MRCPNCGSYIRNDSVFCNYCGQRIEIPKETPEKPIISSRPRDEDFDVAVTPERKPEEEETVPVRQNRWVIFAIIMTAVVIGGLSVLLFDSIRNKQRTVVSVITSDTASEASQSTTVATETASEETETTETESVTIEEKTKEAVTETEESAETTTEPETAAETESLPEESAAETQYPIDAEGYFTADGITYVVADVSKAAIVSCRESGAEVIIPETINGLNVVAVYEGAFEGNIGAQYIYLPEGVAWIGNNAFANCPALKEVVLPSTLGEMSEGAFGGRTDIMIVSPAGSYAEQLAKQYGMQWTEGNAIIVLQ